MKIFVERTKETLTKNFEGRAKDLLEGLKILSEDVLIIRNGRLITEEDQVENSDEIQLLSVISGG